VSINGQLSRVNEMSCGKPITTFRFKLFKKIV